MPYIHSTRTRSIYYIFQLECVGKYISNNNWSWKIAPRFELLNSTFVPIVPTSHELSRSLFTANSFWVLAFTEMFAFDFLLHSNLLLRCRFQRSNLKVIEAQFRISLMENSVWRLLEKNTRFFEKTLESKLRILKIKRFDSMRVFPKYSVKNICLSQSIEQSRINWQTLRAVYSDCSS